MKLTVDFILVTGILLSSFAIIGVLRLNQKKTPQYILVVFWFLILSVIAYFYASLHDLKMLQFIMYYLENGVRFLIPPLLYLYVKSIFIDDHNLLKKSLKHFIVFGVYFISYTIPKSLIPDSNYIYMYQEYIPNWALVQDIFGIVYFILSLKLFYKVSRLMKQSYSNIVEKEFLWIEKFLISFLIVLIVDLIITITEMYFGYNVDWDGYITVLFMIIAMSYLGYYGLKQSTVFIPSFLIQTDDEQVIEEQKQALYLKTSEHDALKVKFQSCMKEDKIYLSPDLNLKVLADAMGISERKLSAFFSEVMHRSFYDSINLFRVEEAKTLLKSDVVESHSITGIGLTCGFSSKSSFYRIFKKRTQMSPLAYRKSVLKESHHT
ncbi:AraC family transcriptional regulator [Psychroserpens ponticola]|uniref:Helix-turn-helix domain-containing protein n=1 Tax=Psychroserpens ponticola TaxID=2932268 RepID=A0ABY7S174_9FLAO|nr:helix-turn-helix domain-containing protein [Psychroserpens ponticola]WCO03145.1 helix-turn-helix domain-containing protein [Psychroserpens ponticola]